MKSNTNFKKSTLELLVLNLLNTTDLYGYELIQLIHSKSDGYFSVPEGALYPVLYKLEEKKYVSSRRELVGKRLRTYYHMEPSGKDYLHQLCEEYNAYHQAMKKLLSYVQSQESERSDT